ncbi:hypothetical protein TrVFT333_008533 [Trichoderma virens FT-333]|nr:hypothetical protein TrVFT333_008533 [Trichoderma virens FT-333]
MADAVLTSLCGICHICAPKYKCPRCNIATCSLKCITTHKAWSQCSGERDQTAYVTKSKLATAAGIDHDYNFLHGIEMASERAERVLVEDKGIIQKDELRPLTMEEVRWKVGRDGRKRKVLVTRVLKQTKERLVDKLLANKLKKLNTVVVSAPQGMTRQKENQTTISRKSGRVNWQVEWFIFEKSLTDTNKTDKSRLLSKLSDDVPLYVGYNALLESQSKSEGKVQKRSFRGVAQNPSTAHWHLASDSLQDPQTGGWISIRTASIDAWPREQDELQRRQFQFFLESAQKRSSQLATLTPLPSEDCLRNILSNTKVLEFPAIYVLREGKLFRLGLFWVQKIPSRPMKSNNGAQNAKVFHNKERDIEEGELGGDGGADEAGDVIAEQSLSEDEDDTSDDESTSSSGSDSD